MYFHCGDVIWVIQLGYPNGDVCKSRQPIVQSLLMPLFMTKGTKCVLLPSVSIAVHG